VSGLIELGVAPLPGQLERGPRGRFRPWVAWS